MMPRARKKNDAAPSPVTRKRKAETLGERIKRFRLAKGLTQTEFGRAIGVSQRVVTYYEVEGSSPSPELLVRIADALGITTDELLGRKEPPQHEAERATKHMRLLHQFKQLEQLPPQDRKAVLKMIDALAIRRQAKGRSQPKTRE